DRMARMPLPGPDASTPSDAERLRDDYLAHLDTLEDTYAALRDALDRASGALRVVADHLRAGGRGSDFKGLIQPAPLRQSLSTAMTNFERSRHRGQQIFFRMLIAEGMTMADIARAWGISRQLVSRLVNEHD